MDKLRAEKLLCPFTPTGYDIYVLCVQECLSDTIFECLDGLLAADGIVRLRLAHGSHSKSDHSKIFGRSERTLRFGNFMGLAVYVKRSLLCDVKLLKVSQLVLDGAAHTNGVIAVALSVLGRTIVFLNMQLESRKNEKRRDQIREILQGMGSSLGEDDFSLGDQFHHVIVCGDLGYELVDTSGNQMPGDMAIKMLEDNLNRSLFESHDQLNKEKKAQLVFYGYREPTPYPDFYPTFKKITNRLPVDYSSPSWVRQSYEPSDVKASFWGPAVLHHDLSYRYCTGGESFYSSMF